MIAFAGSRRFVLGAQRTIRGMLIVLCASGFLRGSYAGGAERANLFSRGMQISDTLRIALEEAVFLGLENNPTVTIQRLDPDIMKTFEREQRAAFDPELILDGQRSEVKSSRRLGSRPTPFDLQDTRFDAGIEIAETLPTGTNLSLSARMTGSVSNLYTDQYTGDLGITITQSLLRGFGFGANLANLRQARLDVEISRWELKGVAERVTADIENSYWDLYLAAREIEIQQTSLELARRQRSESLERVAVGKLPRLELAAVDAEVAARQVALIDAQSRHEQARLQFLYLINPDTESFWCIFPLPVDRPFFPEDTLESIAVHEELGMRYRPDLKQARLALDKGELEIARTKNGLLPQLDLFITLGKSSYSDAFDTAYPDISSPYYQFTAGLAFSLPVPNREASARLSRARFSREQQAAALENMERLVQKEIRSAYVEVLRSRQQIEATRVARELQEIKLDAELEKFRVGKSTNFLVLQAQRDFTAGQMDEVRSMVAYLNALVDLYVSEGTLLDRRRISTFEE